MALEFDLACQFALNRYDLEIEKMRLSVWGEPGNPKANGKHHSKAPSSSHLPKTQTMTAKDIMRDYRNG